MNASQVENRGRSFFDVMCRQSMVTLITFGIVVCTALVVVLTHKFNYGALAHVVLVSDSSGRDPSIAAVDMPTIVTGSTVLLDVQRQLNLSESVNDLRKSVNARVAPKSSLMTIAVQSKSPATAVKVSNAIADTFARLYWNLAGSQHDEVTRRLTAQVDDARTRLRSLERRLESASSGASYVGSQTSLDASAAHLSELRENRGVILGQLVTDRASLQADLDQPGKTAKVVRHEILRNNLGYSEAELLVSKDMAQYTTTRAGVKISYPGIVGFRDKVQKESAALGIMRKNALSGADAYSPSQAGQIVQTAKDRAVIAGEEIKLAAYDEQINTLKQKLSTPPSNAPSMGSLRAERDTAEAQLQALSLALTNAEAGSAEARALGMVVVVDRATEARQTILGPALLFVLGVLAAGVLAISAAYLGEWLVPRLLGSGDVESVYGRPIIATLRAR